MPYTKTNWQDEILADAERFEILDNGGVNAVNEFTDLAQCLIRLKTTVTTAGTPLDATNMNKIEQALYDLFVAVEAPTTNDTLVYLKVLGDTEVWTTGDGKIYFPVPPELNGAVLVNAQAYCMTPSTVNTPTVQVARGRRSTATSTPTWVDMLSTAITIDINEYSSTDDASQRVINTANDDIATRDLIRIDIDVAGTGTKGLDVSLVFRL
jgi:hypothetical protein